jgi:hypothetical protein
MTNLAEQWSEEVRRLRRETTRPARTSELNFGMICLVLLAVLAISVALMFPVADWPATDFLAGP